MKIRVFEDTHHRLTSGRSMFFEKGEYDKVPKSIAEKLIDDGNAEALPSQGSKAVK